LEIVHAGRMGWGANLASHRQGGLAHKVLFEGEEGSPDNFVWAMADEKSDYFSPRHRHVFDQVRLCISGSIPIARDLRVDAGEIGYFPEGVPYGPQEGGPDRLTLVLQVGGISGLGFLSARQVRQAHEELGEEGVFEGGVFRRTKGEGKANLDAYEAIWRRVVGRPIDYPKPRYKTPVIVRPEAYDWRPEPQSPGVSRKRLAVFPERGLELSLLAIEPGATWWFGPVRERLLLFVRSGEGRLQGDGYETWSAARIEPGESVEIAAAAPSEILVISLALVGDIAA
jgi:hypothetical protein